MMNPKAPETLAADYFDRIYQTNPDPWLFESSKYEREKYLATLAALPVERYDQGFEIGGSIGVLTQMLAGRCNQLLSIDLSPIAQERARRRCLDQPNVEFRIMQFPREKPDQCFDLIVLSEVGYYFCQRDLFTARAWIIDSLRPGGHLLLVHWTHFVEDYPLTGDEVHDCFLEVTPTLLTRVYDVKEADYRIDLLSRPPLVVLPERFSKGRS
jgi:SAM-dependent methyltransferase